VSRSCGDSDLGLSGGKERTTANASAMVAVRVCRVPSVAIGNTDVYGYRLEGVGVGVCSGVASRADGLLRELGLRCVSEVQSGAACCVQYAAERVE
jgi:hypothetical protein